MKRFVHLCALALAVSAAPVAAHDTWVQPNTSLIRTGDAIHLDLMLGNHGNEHRDFKLASKLPADQIRSFDVTAPDGKTYDLKPDLIDLGYAPKEGYHSAKFVPGAPGVYIAAQTSDKVVNHGKPVRAYRSAKTLFGVADSLDKPPKGMPGFDRRLGHRIELVPTANPVLEAGPGQAIRVRLLFDGKPLEGVNVSFIPRGATLKDGTDADHERTTDRDGRAAFTPKTGTFYLIAARRATDEKGEGYESTSYTATLTLHIPEKCPCCAD